jgi:hypothetical protein
MAEISPPGLDYIVKCMDEVVKDHGYNLLAEFQFLQEMKLPARFFREEKYKSDPNYNSILETSKSFSKGFLIGYQMNLIYKHHLERMRELSRFFFLIYYDLTANYLESQVGKVKCIWYSLFERSGYFEDEFLAYYDKMKK